MLRIDDILTCAVLSGCEKLFKSAPNAAQISVQRTRPEFEGERTVVVFPFTCLSKKSPEDTGSALGEYIVSHCDDVIAFQVVKGFLNLSIRDSYWVQELNNAVKLSTGFGLKPQGSKPQVMVEYSSPNTNKPLHLGHMRNNFLGYSVSEILKAAGHEVVKVQIINDRGIHICKSMVAWLKFGEGETPQSSGMKGDKLVGKYYVAFDKAYKSQIEEHGEDGAPILLEAREMLHKWENGDEEVRDLWAKMNGWVYEGFDATYKEMGVDFDKLYYESNTYLIGKSQVEKGLSDGVFNQREDGSIYSRNLMSVRFSFMPEEK